MTHKALFTFAGTDTPQGFETRRRPDLLKLVPGKRHPLMFGQSEFSRVIVPVHWDKKSNRSRKCEGSIYCDDCAHLLRKTFHLYAGVYLTSQGSERAIVDLGTSMPDRWMKAPPDFRKLHVISRAAAHGPIVCECQEHTSVDYSLFPGWDIIDDVIRIFAGRISIAKPD